MTSFVHVDQPSEHAGVVRAENAVAAIKELVANFDSGRGAATLMLAAAVSAVMVVAHQVIDTWSEGHLMAAWMLLWVVAFAALALLNAPARRAGAAMRAARASWTASRARDAEDRRTWQVAMQDARVMADLIRAQNYATPVNVRPSH